MLTNTDYADKYRARRRSQDDWLKRRVKHLKKAFRITLEDFEALKVRCNNLCEICGNPESFVDKTSGIVRELCIDHDHRKGNIRGLLCTSCNKNLGQCRDSIFYLDRCSEYLKKYKGE